jgi:hypothetical protein
MNDKRVRQCLLGIASLTHGLRIASEGNETIDNLTMNLTNTLLTAIYDLEREANGQPVRVVALDELETQEMVPIETDKKVTS